MIRRISAIPAVVFATAMVIASAGLAAAQDMGGVPPPKPAPSAKPADPNAFQAALYFGPGFGVAEGFDTDFGWALHALARPFRWGAMQIEYFNLGDSKRNNGNYDGGYFGLMPILPVTNELGIFGQAGVGISDSHSDAAFGGGVLWDLPIPGAKKVFNNGLTLRADYKHFDFAKEADLFTIGVLMGIHK